MKVLVIDGSGNKNTTEKEKTNQRVCFLLLNYVSV